MSLQHAYSLTNILSGLAATAFTWSDGTTANRGNVNDGRMNEPFVSATSVTTINVVIDLGFAQSIGCVGVLNSNAARQGGTPTVKVEAADDAAISVNAITAKALTNLASDVDGPRSRDHILQFPQSLNRRYWRITWAWSGASTFRVGELWMGNLVALSRYTLYGNVESEDFVLGQFVSDTKEVRSHVIGGPIRNKTLPFDDLTPAQRNEIRSIFRNTYGGARAFLWAHVYGATSVAATSDEQDVIFGKLQRPGFRWTEPDLNLNSIDAMELQSLPREVGL